MKNVFVLAVAVSSTTLLACGPGAKLAEGKQSAAEALHAVSGPTKAGATGQGGSSFIGGLNWKCPHGGTATLSLANLSIDLSQGTDVDQKLRIAYDECGLAKADVGVASFDGAMEVSQVVSVHDSAVSVVQTFKGKLLIEGDFDDFLDADITQTVAVGDLDGAGQVSMTLKGRLATSAGSYQYDEDISVTAGHLSVQAGN